MFAQISLWLLWIVLQCSMVGIIAILLMLPLSRSMPDTRGRLAMAGLAAMGIVLLAGIIPGSGWMAQMSDEPPQARSMDRQSGCELRQTFLFLPRFFLFSQK